MSTSAEFVLTFYVLCDSKILATIRMKSDFNGNHVKSDKSFANLKKEERGFRFESYILSTFLYFSVRHSRS